MKKIIIFIMTYKYYNAIIKNVNYLPFKRKTGIEMKFKYDKTRKAVLILINIVLILGAVICSLKYSSYLKEKQEGYDKAAFCSAVESMKQVSLNYIKVELGYANDWAKYITENDMTVSEALKYIKKTNNQKDRYAHIVDMDSFDAYSSYEKDSGNFVQCYKKFSEAKSDETYKLFIKSMRQMFKSDSDMINVLGKYRPDDIHTNVVSVGTKVRLKVHRGKFKEYLLLRLIPVESMRKIWVFPVEYKSAEIGIITKSGAYVIPSKSMKSMSFPDYIRGYNFKDDYNKVDVLYNRIMNTDSGLLEYKDSKGEDVYWYYSRLEDRTGLDILGCIPKSNLSTNGMDWTIVVITCIVLGLLGILDGSYISQINKRLRETAELAEHESKAKTRFLSTMSHDIRTPMNAIIGMTEIAQRNMNDIECVKDCLGKISLASGHLLTLINDILDISKVESGNFALSPTAFSLTKSIENLINIIGAQANDKKITLNTEIKDIKYEYIIADQLRLNQIYINLLTNAVKYTNEGGFVTLSVCEKETAEREKVNVIFSVEDSGIGMSEEFQKNMYTLFTRESDGRIDTVQGTGLGLAIVKQMVDIMKGSIICESEQGKGTKFTVSIELPVSDQKVKDDNTSLTGEDLKNEDFSGMSILIAEDNDINWEIISRLLQNDGIICTRAENGQVCVDKLNGSEDGEFDMIFMDVQMPVMNGKEATRIIRSSVREYVKNITIVAMTADAFAEDMQECLDAGMDSHISKPIDMQKVRKVLIMVKNKKRGLK